jgi:hypothetical protein
MKKLLTVLGVILALAIPPAAFAATSATPAAQAIRCCCGINTSQLTDQQKADLTKQRQKITDLKKETVNKMVTNGALTKEQGASVIKQIDSRMQYCQENGFTGNCGMGNGGGGRRGMRHNGGGHGRLLNPPAK